MPSPGNGAWPHSFKATRTGTGIGGTIAGTEGPCKSSLHEADCNPLEFSTSDGYESHRTIGRGPETANKVGVERELRGRVFAGESVADQRQSYVHRRSFDTVVE